MNGGKEGEIESGRSAELENCGQAEVEDHLRMRMWNLLVMVMRMIMNIENGSMPIQRWNSSMPSLPEAVLNFCQRCKFLHFHSFFLCFYHQNC